MCNVNKIQQQIRSKKPFLIYHNDEDEMAFAVPAEFLTRDLYKVLREFATSDIVLMIPQPVAKKLGMHYLSESLELSADLDEHVKDAIVKSHAGPTFDLKEVKTGSADQDKVLAIKSLSEIVANNRCEEFSDRFVMPGHIRTYIARKGLLSERVGHTELGVFMCLYAGLSGMICMVTIRDKHSGRPLNKIEGENFSAQNKYPVFYEDDILDLYTKQQRNIGDQRDANLSKEKLINDYVKLVQIREFENILEKLFKKNKIQGSYHLAIGQEATGVALGNVIEPGDTVFVTHRGHHIALGLGIDPRKFFLECIGDEKGLNRGLSGPMHFFADGSNRIIANGIVGANAPISTGVALSNKISQNNKVCINIIGEGSLDEGAVHESLNIASIWQVPLMIICENNFYSQSTPIKKHLPTENISTLIENSYKIEAEKVAEGTDLLVLETRLRNVMEVVRKNSQPVFVEVMTYRFCGHSMSDTQQVYKDAAREQYWLKRDPIKIFEKFLLNEMKVSPDEMMETKQEAINKITKLINDIL